MNFDMLYNKILENFDVSENFLDDILTTLEFRLNKNHYLYGNIAKLSKECSSVEQDIIYYEVENLIINIRSTLDNLLQLINVLYKMRLSGVDISVKNIIKHKKMTAALKDIFILHTHPKNQFWNFIYTTRNEVVHEICIKTQLPIMFDESYKNGKVLHNAVFINKAGDKEDLLFFYKQCVKLMDELCESVLYVLSNNFR